MVDPWNHWDAACRCKTENGQDNNDGGDGGDDGDNNNDGTTEYTWGDPCVNLTDGYCGDVDCAECLYSWPSNTTMADPWNHSDAACRCKTENGQDNNDGGDGGDNGSTEYTWGDPCANLTDGYCGDVDCNECLYSWPSNTTMADPWNHSDAACRCKAENEQDNNDGGDGADNNNDGTTEYTWGDSCANLTD